MPPPKPARFLYEGDTSQWRRLVICGLKGALEKVGAEEMTGRLPCGKEGATAQLPQTLPCTNRSNGAELGTFQKDMGM